MLFIVDTRETFVCNTRDAAPRATLAKNTNQNRVWVWMGRQHDGSLLLWVLILL